MVLVQKWSFFNLFFLGNIGQENVFDDILGRNYAFLGYNDKKFQKSKNWHFSKDFSHGFGPKMAIFEIFWGNIGKENVLYDIHERKSGFVGFKNKSSKSRIIDIFPKGLTDGFGPKMAIFPTFFFHAI